MWKADDLASMDAPSSYVVGQSLEFDYTSILGAISIDSMFIESNLRTEYVWNKISESFMMLQSAYEVFIHAYIPFNKMKKRLP